MPEPEYRYKYTPSTSSSSCPISYFALSCNFQELAGKYPEFQSAWTELRRGRQRKRSRHQVHDHVDEGSHHEHLKRHAEKDGTPKIGSLIDDESTDGRLGNDTSNNDSTEDASLPTSQALPAQLTHAFNAALTRSLLDHHFGLQMPSLPEGHLCPPIPNRANYVCWLKELLVQSTQDLYRFTNDSASNSSAEDGSYRTLWQCRGIDIGTGVSAIYPLLLTTKLFAESNAFSGTLGKGGEGCHREQSKQWKFLATDIDPLAIQSACNNVQANNLEGQICVVKVKGTKKGPLFAAMEEAKRQSVFQDGISNASQEMSTYPKFDFVMTNPPFYSTISEATAPRSGDKRSRTDMSRNEGVYTPAFRNASKDMDDCENDTKETADGGDVGFVSAIMNDSQTFRHHVTWYTSLIAKRSSLDAVLGKLQTLDGVWGNRGQIRTVEFCQGNLESSCSDERGDDNRNLRVRWGVAWTYERAVERCSACRVLGGLQSFEVTVNVNESNDDKAKTARDEVVSRLTIYFEGLRDVSLKCSTAMKDNRPTSESEDGHGRGSKQCKPRLCVTAVEERFYNCNSSNMPVLTHEQDNSNLPYEGQFIIDAIVQSSGKCNDSGQICVCIQLEMYSHTKYGMAAVNKIRGPMPGEIGRSNRRWRRLLRKQKSTN